VGGLRKRYRVVKFKIARVVAQESEKPVRLKQEHRYRKKRNNENDGDAHGNGCGGERGIQPRMGQSRPRRRCMVKSRRHRQPVSVVNNSITPRRWDGRFTSAFF